MVTTDIYVHACRDSCTFFQYAVALLVRCTVPEFLLCKASPGCIHLGGICGGLLYMAAYNIFPYFRPMTDYSFMLGASASVLAISRHRLSRAQLSDTATAVRNHRLKYLAHSSL